MVRNENDYIEHVKEYKKKTNYIKALRALNKKAEMKTLHIKRLLTHLSMI